MKTSPGSNERLRVNFPAEFDSVKPNGISLKQLINQLLGQSMPAAFHSKSLITNDVSRDIQVSKERLKIVPVMRELLGAVVTNARNGEIYISAERFRDIIILQIQDRNNYNGYALGYSVRTMESEAGVLGGNITIEGEQQRVITISLSFANANSEVEC